MKALGSSFPLFTRFMVAPMIGAIVIAGLALLVWDYRQTQTEQLEAMRTDHVRLINATALLNTEFSQNHGRVFQLLTSAPQHRHEEAFRADVRSALDALLDFEDRFSALNLDPSLNEEIRAEVSKTQQLLITYRTSASSALERTTADFSLTEGLTTETTQNFNDASRQFLFLNQIIEADLENKIDNYIANLSDVTARLDYIFIAIIAFTLTISAFVARIFSRDLRISIKELSKITQPVSGAHIDADDSSETAMLAKAVGDARESHETLVRAEHLLRRNEQQLQAIFDNNTEALIVANEHGAVTAFNRTAEKMFGYAPEEIIGNNVSMLMPAPYRNEHDSYMGNYLRTGVSKIIGVGREVVALHKNGTEFPIRLGVSEVQDDSERLFLGSITDLTEIKSLEMQLRRSQKIEAIGELTGGIAHDFNNLLGIIIGNLDLLKRKLGNDDTLAKRVEKAQSAALRGSDLTRRLLNFSRQSVEASSPIRINPIIEGLKDLVGKSLTSRVSLELNLADDLWLTEVDPSAFEDVLINLAINARDAMPDGGRLIIETRNMVFDEPPTIRAEGMRVGEYVEIAITDNGSGIPADIREKIFDPFFTTKDKGKGTGLGLAMVYSFMKRSRGSVTVYSEEGVGTIFKLYLPRSTDQAGRRTDKRPALESMPHGTETVLVVDDEAELLDIAERVLQGLGYRTYRAGNAEAALALLDSDIEIDLLFTDVMMPGAKNGFALAKEATLRRPDLKVLLASGFTGRMILSEMDSKWTETFLGKPYRIVELAHRIRKVLDEDS